MTVQVDRLYLSVYTGATSERPDRIGGTSPPRICVKRCFSLYLASAKSPHDGGALGRRGGMADAIDLGSIALTGVEVRVLSSAPWADGGPWPSGKASPLQGEDRRFESDRVHLVPSASMIVEVVSYLAGVVQW